MTKTKQLLAYAATLVSVLVVGCGASPTVSAPPNVSNASQNASVTTASTVTNNSNVTVGTPTNSTLPVVINSKCPSNPTLGVYHPYRLEIRNPCMTVSGTVAIVRHETDKDYHINVKLDSQYASLINARNVSGEHGDLVVEIIAMEDGHVPIPAVGEHVTVTGPYVLDKDHGWMEIHPAWFINGQGTANYTAVQAAASVQEALTGNGDESSYSPPPSSSTTSTSTSSSSSNTSVSKLVIVSSNLNVTPGEYASVTIRTTPGASVSIEVDYESGPSKSTSLYPKTAGSDGTVTWQWKVGTRTTPGQWPVIITANGQTVQTTVNVQ